MSKCGWVAAQLEAFESERETTRVQLILYRLYFSCFGSFFILISLLNFKLVLLIEN